MQAADFHLHSTPLPPGITLLEASAGTGKTYTIAGIVTRLVASSGLQLREILVVTFTEAATLELRGRIRQHLLQVSQRLSGLDPATAAAASTDESMDPVVRAILAEGIPISTALRRLALALASFDEATISTIHGFCQRLLRDNAFEGDAPFESEVITDANALLLDLAHDFWHQHLRTAPPLVAALANSADLTPKHLAKLRAQVAQKARLRLLPEASQSLATATTALTLAWQTALASWRQRGAQLSAQLRDHRSISRNREKGFPPNRLQTLQRALDDGATTAVPTVAAIKALRSLTTATIDTLRLKTAAALKNPFPHDEFFDRCSEFEAAMSNWVVALRAAWLTFAEETLPRLKAERGVLTFDDMLSGTNAALESMQGKALAAAVRKQFRAALIDEFQDTDPIQYDIFRRLFAEPPQRLMLIGDPKQAIYGFRGADLFTYLGAKRDVLGAQPPRIYTLRTNYRSSTALVAAVNAVFAERPDCFLQAGIEFVEVNADGEKAAQRPLRAPAADSFEPLVFVDADRAAGEDSMDGQFAAITTDIASEISRLLQDWQLGGQALSAADIAVLVRTHHQAAAVEDALHAAGIPAVRRTDESVFDSLEADELLRILAAVVEPARESTLRTALTASCFGLTADELLALDTDLQSWTGWVDGFSSLRERWTQRGFAAMFRELLVRWQLRSRMMALRGGERRLTNLLHLVELAQQAEHQLRLSNEGVIEWLREQQRNGDATPEEHVQRLERDDDAVKVVTVHNAKGLEYPVVFCPAHWKNKALRDVLFHEAEPPHRLTFDLSKPKLPDHVALAEREMLAEEMRVLYVALTRAVQRCYVYVSTHKDSADSPLGVLLGDDPVAGARSLADRYPQLIGMRGLHPADHDDASMAAAVVPSTEPSAELREREIRRPADGTPLVGSFSRLVADVGEDYAQDHDELDVDTTDATEGAEVSAIFRLKRGAATGIALHAVLEHADFRRPDSLAPLIATEFAALQLPAEFHVALQQQLTALLSHPLQADGRIVRLDEVATTDRLNEVEFYYPVKPFSARALAAACTLPPDSAVPQQIGRLQFKPIDGYLRGFMDLVFRHEGRYYLADWKSNWLGNRSADYSPERLERAMAGNFYHLQSWLYALALDRFLAARLNDYEYEQHFGGIFYLFVRGLDPAVPQRGVHFARPSARFLQRLGAAVLRDHDADRNARDPA